MSRKSIVAGNWKMNKTATEATQLAQQLSYGYEDRFGALDVVICPPYTDLRSVQVTLGFDNSPYLLGAQDVYWQPEGAYTGAISTSMLADLGCRYCIVGHSERRRYFGESDADVGRKTAALAAAGIAPILCCGESLEQRTQGQTLAFVSGQLRAALSDISAQAAERLVVAYEPLWAIGTGQSATPEQAEEVCLAIRAEVAALYGPDFAEAVRILYGGSLNPGNAGEFCTQPDIDGGLVGAASLDALTFLELVRAFS
ncbi:MAG: triose-phosphate isomerase [Coriobacteriales bacterium]|jgi:triosephosphate isomerase|nr:triose-phosphate isomerase [Coriobacteriales bacterium]